MTQQKANEVWISVDLMRGMLTADGSVRPPMSVVKGPGEEARIIDVRWGGDVIVLVYDREVEPLLVKSINKWPLDSETLMRMTWGFDDS